MSTNSNLNRARAAKNDEFYTRLPDIENELAHYKGCFAGKVVYCNCDDPGRSNFVGYFVDNFKALGLRMLIASHYKEQSPDVFGLADPGTKGPARYMVYKGGDMVVRPLKKDGDFRGKECTALLRRADIVVTNPPFSLFGDHMAQLIRHNKDFLVIGNHIAINYKNVHTLLKDNKIRLGHTHKPMSFDIPDRQGGLVGKTVGVCWYTTFDVNKKNKYIHLARAYDEGRYPTYDNYNAIEVCEIKDIPNDYDGEMGVPTSYMHVHNPEQFTILGLSRYLKRNTRKHADFTINGKLVYMRVVIRHNNKPTTNQKIISNKLNPCLF